MSAFARFREWYLEPAPPERLAVLRILTGTFAVVYLVVRMPEFLSVADGPPARFDPVGVLAWMDAPWSETVATALPLATLGAAAVYATGVGFRGAGPLFAALLLVTTTYRSSWGQVVHFENLLVLHVLIVSVAPAADAWVPWPRFRRGGSAPPRAGYGWPVRLMAMVTVATYFVAGVAKLRETGPDWAVGDTVANHIAFTNARLAVHGEAVSPFAEALLSLPGLTLISTLAAVVTLVVELGAPVALLGGRWRWWVAATWGMHAGILATMFIFFPYPFVLVAFAPLFRVEHLPARVRAALSRAARRGSRCGPATGRATPRQ